MQTLTALSHSTSLRISLLLLLLPTLAHANLPKAANVPGGVAVVQLGNTLTHKQKPQAWFDNKPVLVTADLKSWYAVVGLPLSTKPGQYKLNVTLGNKNIVLNFKVKNKKYPEQHIVITDKGKVELNPENEARAVREIATIKALKFHWRDTQDTDLNFIIPAEGRLSGNFGLRRVFNGQPRSPHAGLDVAVARGTPIMSSAPGTVLATDDYFFNGKTIFVDHGNGLITMYCHLDQFDVKVGDDVNKGQQLGLSGMTGRATGPHLHWSVILNGAMVDPALFVPAKRRDQ